MKVDERALKDVHTVGGGETPPCVGLTSNTGRSFTTSYGVYIF